MSLGDYVVRGMDRDFREVLYRAGCVHALASKQHPEHQGPALKLLAEALQDGFGASYLAGDPDLAPLRPLPGFKKLLTAAAALAA